MRKFPPKPRQFITALLKSFLMPIVLILVLVLIFAAVDLVKVMANIVNMPPDEFSAVLIAVLTFGIFSKNYVEHEDKKTEMFHQFEEPKPIIELEGEGSSIEAVIENVGTDVAYNMLLTIASPALSVDNTYFIPVLKVHQKHIIKHEGLNSILNTQMSLAYVDFKIVFYNSYRSAPLKCERRIPLNARCR